MKLKITNIDDNYLLSNGVFIALAYFMNPIHSRGSMRRLPSQARANRTSLFPQPTPPTDTKKPVNDPPRLTPTGDAQIRIASPDRKITIESGLVYALPCSDPYPVRNPDARSNSLDRASGPFNIFRRLE
jgi:hypothetical protein